MSYQYDIFLSYNRKFPYRQWVDEIFYPLFKPYLEDALNQEVSIFKDNEEIKTGTVKNAPIYIELQDVLQKWVYDVAAAIKSAPSHLLKLPKKSKDLFYISSIKKKWNKEVLYGK